MSRAWAARLRADDVNALAALRRLPDVQWARAPNGFWIRGRHRSDAILAELRKLPIERLYEVDALDRLTPLSCLVPTDRLPMLPWEPIAGAFQFQAPICALPGALANRIQVRLIRSDQQLDAGAMLVSMDAFHAWVISAPQVRLQRLTFAMQEAAGTALVRGTPLPPLPGRPFYQADRVLAPCGYRWQPAVPPQTLIRLHAVADDQWLLLTPDGAHHKLRDLDFVAANRGAVRDSYRTLRGV